MAINFLNTVDLNFNQLNKAAIQNLGADPAAGVLGQVYYNTAVSALKICTTAQVVGAANAVWTEVGATSGVETITIGNANVNSGGVNTGLVRTPVAGTGDIILTPAIYGGAANVGMVPTGGTANQYLDGAGNWVDVATGDIESVLQATASNLLGINVVDPGGPNPVVGLNITGSDALGGTPNVADQLMIYDADTNKNKKITVANLVAAAPQGDVTAVNGGTYITTVNAGGPVVTVNHDTTTRTNTTSTATPGYGATFTALDSVTTNTTGHVTGVNTKTVTIPASDDTTYDLLTAPTGTAIRLDPSTGTDDDVTISGTTGQTAMSRISASELRVALTSNVTITNDLTVGGEINQTSIGNENSFKSAINMNTAKLLNVGTGTAATDGVNLGQVELLVAGVGVFQGGFNATTGLTVPGGLEIEGTSNIALDKGDYFVVTTAGSDFFTLALEPGDFIFAEIAIAANSSPVVGDYIVVQADSNIAGAGATDGATQKGVAGFDSENFAVSSNGWVQLKRQSNPYGISVPLTGGSNSGGQTTFTVDITTAARFGAGALAANCKAEVVTTSGRQTVYPDITGNGTGSMVFKFIPTVSDSTYTALISIV